MAGEQVEPHECADARTHLARLNLARLRLREGVFCPTLLASYSGPPQRSLALPSSTLPYLGRNLL